MQFLGYNMWAHQFLSKVGCNLDDHEFHQVKLQVSQSMVSMNNTYTFQDKVELSLLESITNHWDQGTEE